LEIKLTMIQPTVLLPQQSDLSYSEVLESKHNLLEVAPRIKFEKYHRWVGYRNSSRSNSYRRFLHFKKL